MYVAVQTTAANNNFNNLNITIFTTGAELNTIPHQQVVPNSERSKRQRASSPENVLDRLQPSLWETVSGPNQLQVRP